MSIKEHLKEMREERENRKLVKERVKNILEKQEFWNSVEAWEGDPKEYKITAKIKSLLQGEEDSRYCLAEVEYYRQAGREKTRALFLIDLSEKGKAYEVDSSLPDDKGSFNLFGISKEKGGVIAVAYESRMKNPPIKGLKKDKIVGYVNIK